MIRVKLSRLTYQRLMKASRLNFIRQMEDDKGIVTIEVSDSIAISLLKLDPDYEVAINKLIRKENASRKT